MKKIIFAAFVFLNFALISCVTGPAGKEKVMTAYMQSGNLKYYIRPGKMLPENFKDTKSKDYVMIDFSYQMEKRKYVSEAYTNFTLYCKTNAYIEEASFLLPDGDKIKKVRLLDISTVDRDAVKGFIRVSTVLEREYVKEVLENLRSSKAVLTISLDDGSLLKFESSQDITERINEAFSK